MINKLLLIILTITSVSCTNNKEFLNAGKPQVTRTNDWDAPEPDANISWKKLFPTDSLEKWINNAVNSKYFRKNTWSLRNGILKTSGKPLGVLYSKKIYKNFEMQFEWKHTKYAGNSGLFIWIGNTGKPNELAEGIEIQVLDTGYQEKYYKNKKRKKGSAWFSSHGDVFSVGRSSIKPFRPISPSPSQSKRRSLPTEERVKPTGQWNHYYFTAINGIVKLWVNGKYVSGGSHAIPNIGPIAFESEGAPTFFRNIYIKELK